MVDETIDDESDPNSELNSSGGASLDGYLYQLDVSIWVALELLLFKKIANQLVLEPASQEDLETDIEDHAGALVQNIVMDNYHLVIQCKFKNTNTWNTGDIKRLLSHGTERVSAGERLADPAIRYLLITNADVSGRAGDLKVDNLGIWPIASNMPASIVAALPDGAVGRVAVLAPLLRELLDFRIEKLLTSRFGIAISNVKRCVLDLRQEGLNRMVGAGDGKWKREEIERVITSHNGYISANTNIVGYVRPKNWQEFINVLDNKHILIIVGESGTGKTTASNALVAYLRGEIPGIEVVNIVGGPEKIRAHSSANSTVFEVEDPWGKYRLEPHSIPWKDAIFNLLKQAAPNRKFIITTRSDILAKIDPQFLQTGCIVHLERENYGATELSAIFDNQVPKLKREIQSLIVPLKKLATDSLSTPLEMARYFDILSSGPNSDEKVRDFVKRCIATAHHSSIETSILDGINQNSEWELAAVVWGLFKAQPKLSFNIISTIQFAFGKIDQKFEDGLDDFIAFLISGRHIRQNESILTYQHPRVEYGLEKGMKVKVGATRRVLNNLIGILLNEGNGHGGDWGKESAANLLHAIKRLPDFSFELRESSVAPIDDWIERKLSCIGENFEDDLRLASVIGSCKCMPAELARWLLAFEKDELFGTHYWKQTCTEPSWYSAIQDNPNTRKICEAFVARLLPHQNNYYPDDFITEINHIADDLAPEFFEAAISILEDGTTNNDRVIALGAMMNPRYAMTIVEASVAFRNSITHSEYLRTILPVMNGEYDDAAADHYSEGSEEGYTASQFISIYVEISRKENGWPRLLEHHLVKDFVYPWIHEIANEMEPDELLALGEISVKTEAEGYFWTTSKRRWNDILAPTLALRLVEGSDDFRTRTAISEIAVEKNYLEIFGAAVNQLIALDRESRIFELALDIVSIDENLSTEETFKILSKFLLCNVSKTLNSAITTLIDINIVPLKEEALESIKRIDPGNNYSLEFCKLRALSKNGLDVEKEIDALLSRNIENDQRAIKIIKELVELCVQKGYWIRVESALQHKFADVREVALIALADRSVGALNENLLRLVGDRGHRVRSTLLKIIKNKVHKEHTPALLALISDTWSPDNYGYYEERRYPIALLAAELIDEHVDLTDSISDELLKVAIATKNTLLCSRLFSTIIFKGSLKNKEAALHYALHTDSISKKQISTKAIAVRAEYLNPELISLFTDQKMEDEIPEIAIWIAFIIGTCTDKRRVSSSARILAVSPKRCALLFVMWIASEHTNSGHSEKIFELFPIEFASKLKGKDFNHQKLERGALDAFGDVYIVEAIKSEFSSFFEKVINRR